MGQATAVQAQNVISSWGKILYKSAGKAERFYQFVADQLSEIGIPGINWTFEEIGARKKMLGGAKGELRRSLTISSEGILAVHRVGAQDFGSCLSISRYLTVRDTKFLPDPEIMTIFEKEKLVVYNSVVQNAVVSAAKMLMKELGEDPSSLDIESKGFLEVW